MHQLTLTPPGSLAWQDVPDPPPPAGPAALVRPIAIATCDFDHLVVAGRMLPGHSMAIGHECVAEVVAVGPDVERAAPGDVVVLPFEIACGTCATCRRGATSSCERLPFLSCYGLGRAAGDFGGVAADLVAVPYADAMLVRLPEGVAPAAAAAVGCNVVDAYRGVGPQLEALPGAPVLVLGGAFPNIALYTVQLACALGSERVVLVDQRAEVRARAEALGASVLERGEDLDSETFPIAMDASMDADLLAHGIRALGPAGELTISTMYARGPVALPLMDLFARCATVRTGQPHARPLLDPVLDLIATGVVDPTLVTDRTWRWEDAPQAFGAGAGKHVVLR